MKQYGTRSMLLGIACALVLVGIALAVITHASPGKTPAARTPSPTPTTSASPATASPSPSADSDVFPGGLYVEAGTNADDAANRLVQEGQKSAAALVSRISTQPTAIWLGEWTTGPALTKLLAQHVAAAKAEGTTLVFVTYAIPNRDCGGYSRGGLSYDNYLDWNRTIATTLAGTKSVVLVEPDSLSMLSSAKCGTEAIKRIPLINEAVDILAGAGLTTYLDGGNSRWHSSQTQAKVLKEAGIDHAHGFFTNVSNFNTVQQERDYAGKLSGLVGDKHYVVDVSRSGKGWKGDWCNPKGAGLGPNPHATPNDGRLDAELWVKHPGVSDGTCNGGPAAGMWWEQYALDLVRNG
ncbi:glycoside hydrolase family 6 protein [Lacisediminihabitans sp.]|uniref:glycoside hydrolase family 6 protein n=1 Tax=Lacisediminihabitans sp. TaxID=2787631 RepID=UPI002F941568